MPFLNSLIGNTEEEKSEWYDIVGQFRERATEFKSAFNTLLQQAQFTAPNPQLHNEWNTLTNRGMNIKNKIQSITNTIDQVTSWIDSVFGELDTNNNLGALNAVWIPIAIVVAGVTAISKWTFDYVTFMNKLAEIKRLQTEQNLTPAAAVAIVNKIEGQSKIMSMIQSILPFVLLGGAIILNRGK